MPKLWSESIEAHRQAVRDAALDATDSLVARRGFAAVTMSQVAEDAGIGRATLYKYFADVDAVIAAWHERLIAGHLRQLHEIRDSAGDAIGRLEAVLMAYAFMSHHRHGMEAASLLHQGEHVNRALQQLSDFVRDLLAGGATSGAIRKDVAPEELAIYCLHALSAASGLTSHEAVRRLVAVTLDGLRGNE
ncbi:TetR/AcrR family transcriptional regulator [Homoserinimonas sp. A447]